MGFIIEYSKYKKILMIRISGIILERINER